MERTYFTRKGSIYTQTTEHGRELWVKQNKDGPIQPLVAAVHISSKRLTELIKEYPASLLDKTYCFDIDVEREFFEDARRERFKGDIKNDQTVIFFLIKRDPGKFGLGCSSAVEKIEYSYKTSG